MVRLFRILKQPNPEVGKEKWRKWDANSNGKVGWYEFCSFWKESADTFVVRLTIAERLFLTLEDAERSICGRIMSVIVFIAILVSTGCFVLGTVPDFQSKCVLEGEPNFDPDCKPQTDMFFQNADLTCVVFFSVEYGLRLLLSGVMRMELVDRDRQTLLEWMVTEDTIREPNFIRRVSQWFFYPANLIDLAAIMPWFLSKTFAEVPGASDSFFIRLIRLTRVIRAIRLGKKFEAVIIVARSVRRSLRALYVLVLNLILGVIIFGALMYFCEQGSWDKTKQAYLRLEGQRFNEETKEWENYYDRSPFDSIPACFWWAIVTATTVGYGDMFPTTAAGKAIAGVSMAWSLCVLALPIGVIGNNFSTVWKEYDEEKKRERWNEIKEQMMLKRSIAWGDPLHYSRRILLEVWHDPNYDAEEAEKREGKDAGEDFKKRRKEEQDGLDQDYNDDEELVKRGKDDDQAEFMGEVDFTIEMPPTHPVTRMYTLPLTPNLEKARRRVRGTITFEYCWTPQPDSYAKIGSDEECAECHGELKVTVLAGNDLIAIDWKGNCSSDPYCVVVAYPQSPPMDGRVEPQWQKSETECDTSDPKFGPWTVVDGKWAKSHKGFEAKFQFQWTKDGSAQWVEADKRQMGNGIESSPVISAPTRKSALVPDKHPGAGPSSGQASQAMSSIVEYEKLSEEEKKAKMQTLVPELQKEVRMLQDEEIPNLKSEIQAVTKGLNDIKNLLRIRGGSLSEMNRSNSGEQKSPMSVSFPAEGSTPWR